MLIISKGRQEGKTTELLELASNEIKDGNNTLIISKNGNESKIITKRFVDLIDEKEELNRLEVHTIGSVIGNESLLRSKRFHKFFMDDSIDCMQSILRIKYHAELLDAYIAIDDQLSHPFKLEYTDNEISSYLNRDYDLNQKKIYTAFSYMNKCKKMIGNFINYILHVYSEREDICIITSTEDRRTFLYEKICQCGYSENDINIYLSSEYFFQHEEEMETNVFIYDFEYVLNQVMSFYLNGFNLNAVVL